MTSDPIEDIVFFGLALNEGAGGAEHRLKTAKCPTIPEFERLAKLPIANWSVMQFLHVKGCPYCQLSLKLFRQHLGIKPWWELWGERAQQIIDSVGQLPQPARALEKELLALCSVPAVVIDQNQGMKKSSVAILMAEVTRDACLRLRIRMKWIDGQEERLFSADQMPIELTLVTHPTGEPLGALLLPNLIGTGEENFKIQLSEECRENLEKWLDEKKREDEFPIRFVLSPSGRRAE